MALTDSELEPFRQALALVTGEAGERPDPVRWVGRKLGEKLYEKQRDVCMSVANNRRTAVPSAFDTGKCMDTQSKVVLADGRVVAAGDLVGAIFELPGFDPETGSQAPVRAWATDNGVRPLYRVTTVSGRSLVRTGNHPLWAARKEGGTVGGVPTGRPVTYAVDGWTHVDQLAARRYIAVPDRLAINGQDRQDQAKVIAAAYLIADGSLTVSTSLSKHPGPIRDEFRAVAAQLGWTTSLGPAHTGRVNISGTRADLTAWGLYGIKSTAKTIPWWVHRLPNDQVAVFLSRLLSCDGWAHLSGNGYEIGYSTASAELIEGAEILFARLGLHGRIRRRISNQPVKGYVSWTWTISDPESVARFAEIVGPLVGKEAAFARVTAGAVEADRPRARARAAAGRRGAPPGFSWDEIATVEPLGDGRSVCISVDHETHAFTQLAAEHNSFSASRLAAWWIDTHPPGQAIVVTTATTFAQVRAILWQEIGAAHRKSKLLPGHVNQTEWWIGDVLVGFGRRPRDWSPDAFTGIHRPYVLVIIDEASGVPKGIFDACEGLITNADSRILAIGNPYAPDSHFAHICRPDSPWNVIPISAFDTPAYTGEAMPDIAMRSLVSRVWVDENTAEWGTDSPLYVTKILGRFPDESDDQLLPLSWIQAAIDHDVPVTTNHPTIGVDVARFGEDETVIAARWGWHIELADIMRKKATTHVTGAVAQLARRLESRDVRVDGDGLGAGVVDGLRELGVSVDELRNGMPAQDPANYLNARSEWWWHLRRAFEAREPDIPDDDRLTAQLSSLHWGIDSKGRTYIESKDDMRKRGVKSPDRAEAVLYTTARSRSVAPVVAPVAAPQASYVNP